MMNESPIPTYSSAVLDCFEAQLFDLGCAPLRSVEQTAPALQSVPSPAHSTAVPVQVALPGHTQLRPSLDDHISRTVDRESSARGPTRSPIQADQELSTRHKDQLAPKRLVSWRLCGIFEPIGPIRVKVLCACIGLLQPDDPHY
jgi:hypothetical protein